MWLSACSDDLKLLWSFRDPFYAHHPSFEFIKAMKPGQKVTYTCTDSAVQVARFCLVCESLCCNAQNGDMIKAMKLGQTVTYMRTCTQAWSVHLCLVCASLCCFCTKLNSCACLKYYSCQWKMSDLYCLFTNAYVCHGEVMMLGHTPSRFSFTKAMCVQLHATSNFKMASVYLVGNAQTHRHGM